jgi:hypothetical protein
MAEGGAAYNEQASMLNANPGLKLEVFSGGGNFGINNLLDMKNIEAQTSEYKMDGGARGMIDGLENEGLEVSKFLIAIGFGKPNTFAGYTFNDVAYNTFKGVLTDVEFTTSHSDSEVYTKINELFVAEMKAASAKMNGGALTDGNIKNVLTVLYNYIKIISNEFTNFTFLYDGVNAKMSGGAAPIGTLHGDIKINLERIFTNYSQLITKLQSKENTEFAEFNPIAFNDNDKQKLIDIESFLEVINGKLQIDENDDNLDFISEFILKINSFNDLLRIYSESKNAVNQSSEATFDAIKTAYESLNTEYEEVIAQIDADYDKRAVDEESSPEFNPNFSNQSAAVAATLPAPPSSNFNIPEPQGPVQNAPLSSQQPTPQTSPNYQQFIKGFHGYLTLAVEQGYIPNWKGSYKDSKKLQSMMDTLAEDSPIREQFEAEKGQLDPKSPEITTMHEYEKNKAQKYLDVARENLKTLKLYASALKTNPQLAKLDIFTEDDFTLFDKYGRDDESFTIGDKSIIPSEMFQLYKTTILDNFDTFKNMVDEYIYKLENIIIPTLQEIVAGTFKRALKATGQAFSTAGRATGQAFGKAGRATGQAFGTAGRAVRNTTLKAARGVGKGATALGQGVVKGALGAAALGTEAYRGAKALTQGAVRTAKAIPGILGREVLGAREAPKSLTSVVPPGGLAGQNELGGNNANNTFTGGNGRRTLRNRSRM